MTTWVLFYSAKGGELFEYINTEGHLDEKVTVRLMRQILDGIAFLHKNSIAHLDVKVKYTWIIHSVVVILGFKV